MTTTIRRSGRPATGRNTSRRTRGPVAPLGGEGLSSHPKRTLDLDASVSMSDLHGDASSARLSDHAGQAGTGEGAGSGFVVLHGVNLLTTSPVGKWESCSSLETAGFSQ